MRSGAPTARALTCAHQTGDHRAMTPVWRLGLREDRLLTRADLREPPADARGAEKTTGLLCRPTPHNTGGDPLIRAATILIKPATVSSIGDMGRLAGTRTNPRINARAKI